MTDALEPFEVSGETLVNEIKEAFPTKEDWEQFGLSPEVLKKLLVGLGIIVKPTPTGEVAKVDTSDADEVCKAVYKEFKERYASLSVEKLRDVLIGTDGQIKNLLLVQPSDFASIVGAVWLVI